MVRREFGQQQIEGYEAIVQLFKQFQTHYRRARKELEAVSSRFGEREAVTGKQLSTTLDTLNRMAYGSKRKIVESSGPTTKEPRPYTKSGTTEPAGQSSCPTIEAYCLGIFEVRIGWTKVENWRSSKAKSLLKYLICKQRQPVSRDVLIELLWPNCEPRQANNSLKVTVHSLRKTLSSVLDRKDEFPWIIFEDGMYTINPVAELWIDFEQFEYHWRTACRFEKENKLAEALAHHEAAEALYKGDFLQEDLYDDWTLLRRESLKNTYLTILSRLADCALSRSDYETCASYCQKILASERCREDAYQRLIQCYSRLGRRTEAMKWYRLCEKIMKAELDTPPGRDTVLLYRTLLNGDHI
jgi:DNA-binding SARP family transcriptional activator